MSTYEDFSNCRLERTPDECRETFVQAVRIFLFHYTRLFRTMREDWKRGMRKPKDGGRRRLHPLDAHEIAFLRGKKS